MVGSILVNMPVNTAINYSRQCGALVQEKCQVPGFNEGVQVQSGRVSEVHTDFIFAVIGEEFGFIGASILISLYFLLIFFKI